MTDVTVQRRTSDFINQQRAGVEMLAHPLFDGIEQALKYQHEGLKQFEGVVSEHLGRRLAACTAMQHLIARMRDERDPAKILEAQREWFSGAVERMTADALAWQSAGTALLKSAKPMSESGAAQYAPPREKTQAPRVDPEAASPTSLRRSDIKAG
jgi:hypothetical protein